MDSAMVGKVGREDARGRASSDATTLISNVQF